MTHYLDYAATSAVRPREVAEAVASYLTELGCSPGRGGYGLAVEAERIAFRCRRAVARVLGLPGSPGRIAFMQNATHALNTALFGMLREGDVVVVTAFDHNAVLRPVFKLSRERGVEVRMIPGAPDGSLDMEEARRMLDGARLLVVNGASNVLGTRLPVGELAALARDAGALVLVDAAQWAGHFAESLAHLGADLVAFTGHKGLLGPHGTGGLWVREGVDVGPLLTGGTGGDSALRDMPPAYPDRLEAGTLNAPGIAGLLAGVEFVLRTGVEEIHRREIELKLRLHEGLDALDGVRVLSPAAPDGVGIVTIVSDRTDPGTMAERLDREFGVMVRQGLHCAPEVHRLLGTEEDGAVRFSLGWASTEEDVDQAIRAVEAITAAPTVAVG